MTSRSDNESNNTDGFIAAFLDERSCLFDDICSPMEQTLPEAGKTPTIPIQVADLAAALDWGQWERAQLQYAQPGETCIIYLCM